MTTKFAFLNNRTMQSHGCQNKKGDFDTFHANWSHVQIYN